MDGVKIGSDRAFGFVFGCASVVTAIWPLRAGHPVRGWALSLAACFFLLALFRAHWLHPLNVLWTKFGILLGKIVQPIVLSLLYVLIFVPIGCAMRLAGRDALLLKFDPKLPTYWVKRNPPGPSPQSMGHQF